MRLLQAHRLGRDPGLRYGRSQRARALRHRFQGVQRLCLRHGCRAYHQPEVSRQRPPYVLRERYPFPRRIRSCQLTAAQPHNERALENIQSPFPICFFVSDYLWPHLILTIIHRPNIHHFGNAYQQYLH